MQKQRMVFKPSKVWQTRLSPQAIDYLKKLPNRSKWLRQAVEEKLQREGVKQ